MTTLRKYMLGVVLCVGMAAASEASAESVTGGKIQPYAFLRAGAALGYMYTDFGTSHKDDWWAPALTGRTGLGLGVGRIRMEAEVSLYTRMAGENERFFNVGGIGWVSQTRTRFIEMQTYMGAVYYDLNAFGNGKRWTPFVGGGLGVARTKTYSGIRRSESRTVRNNDTKRDTDIAAMVAGGVGYRWKSWAVLDASARYTLVNTHDILSIFSVDAGIRFLF